jgi:hypothetical protein
LPGKWLIASKWAPNITDEQYKDIVCLAYDITIAAKTKIADIEYLYKLLHKE